MAKSRKGAGARGASLRLTKAQERDLLLGALLDAGDYDLAAEIAYEQLPPSQGAPARKVKVTRKPATVQLHGSDKLRERVKRERALRAAGTRKRPHRLITSKVRRVTAGRVRYKEVGWEFGDIVSGRKEHGAEIRAQFDALSAPHIGNDVQISFGCTAYEGGQWAGYKRIRMIARNFQGRTDIARLSSYAIREAMVLLGSKGEIYISSVSIQVID